MLDDEKDVHEFETKFISTGELFKLSRVRSEIEMLEAKKHIADLEHTLLQYKYRDALAKVEDSRKSLEAEQRGRMAKLKNLTSEIGDKYQVGDDWTYDEETGKLTIL